MSDNPEDMGVAATSALSHPFGAEPVPVSGKAGIANAGAFIEALRIATEMYTDVELAFWLTAPQPLIGMWTPIQLLARDEADKLLAVLRSLKDGNYV